MRNFIIYYKKYILITSYVFSLAVMIEFFSFTLYIVLKNKIEFSSNAIPPKNHKWILPISTETGWTSRGDRLMSGQSAKISIYGDSLTYCDEVDMTHSWPFLLAKNINPSVANYGVSGFGVDQSYLYYKSNLKMSKSKINILSFASENILRNLNVYRPFYFQKTTLFYTKPRYILSNNNVKFLMNPIRSKSETQLLFDINFLEKLGVNDFWFKPNLPRGVFPFFTTLFNKSFWDQLRNSKNTHTNHTTQAMWTNHEALKIQDFILKNFIQNNVKKQTTPILLHLPSKAEIKQYVEKREVPKSILHTKKYCESNEVHCWFPLLEIIDYKAKKLTSLFMPGGHYSEKGNKILATYLTKKLNTIVLQRTPH